MEDGVCCDAVSVSYAQNTAFSIFTAALETIRLFGFDNLPFATWPLGESGMGCYLGPTQSAIDPTPPRLQRLKHGVETVGFAFSLASSASSAAFCCSAKASLSEQLLKG